MKQNKIIDMYSNIPNIIILDINSDVVFKSDNISKSDLDCSKDLIQNNTQYPLEKQLGINTFSIDKKQDKDVYFVVSIERYISKKYTDPFLNLHHMLYDKMLEGVIIFRNRELIYRNPSLANTLNFSLEEKDVIPFDNLDVGPSNAVLEKYFNENDQGDMVLPFTFPNSDNYWFKISFQRYDFNENQYHVMIISDISTLKEKEQQYKEEQEYLNRIIESVSEAVILTDKSFNITLLNPVAIELLNVNNKDIINKPLKDYVVLVDNNDVYFDFTKQSEIKMEELMIQTNDGLLRHVRATMSTIYRPDKTIEGYVIVLIDISQMKKRERDILYLSYHDVLTGLYNRTYLEEQMRRLDTKRQNPFSIMMADVNGLKLTNDVFGHDIGDQLLIKIAEILKFSCRSEDLIGRYGGDEFLVLLPNTDRETTNIIMNRILRNFENLTEKDSIKGIIPSVSIGYGIRTSIDISIQDILSEAETNMYKRKMLSKDSVYSSAITSMKLTLYEKSSETEEHANRLYNYCYTIAKKYDLSDSQLDDLELFCMLHDIGKIAISDAILNKVEPLTEEEWKELKTHPEIGYRIVNATPNLQRVGTYILHHHERYDGTGYPSGQIGEQIPLLDRILSVADAYDAMTNDRVYKAAVTKEEAIEELIRHKGTQFDPKVVDLFVDYINNLQK